MASDKEIAQEGCNEAFKECIKKITDVLVTCLAIAKNDAEKQECRERYKRGMRLCKEAYEINKAVIDEVFAMGPRPPTGSELASATGESKRCALIEQGLLEG